MLVLMAFTTSMEPSLNWESKLEASFGVAFSRRCVMIRDIQGVGLTDEPDRRCDEALHKSEGILKGPISALSLKALG